MENFNLKKFLVENKLTHNSRLQEGTTLKPEEQKVVDDILGSLDEGMFDNVLDKVKAYGRKGMLTAAIVTALLATPNLTQAQKQDVKNVAATEMSSHQVDIQKLATNQPTAKATQTQDVQVQSYTKVIEQAITKGTKSQVSNLVIQVTKITDTGSGKVDVLYEVSGNVLASSQKDANAKAMSMVKAALGEANISIAGLTVLFEQQGEKPFPFKLQLKVAVPKNK
tara:strand:+ start:1892 stop:2563 length:672 start_codon:yes stop_codon:yes gene_type:complete